MKCAALILFLSSLFVFGQSSQSFYLSRKVTATNYTLLANGDTYIAATATVTNTLPAANTTRSGQTFFIQDVGGNVITVRPAGANTINGLTGSDYVTGKRLGIYVSNGTNGWERSTIQQPETSVFSNVAAMLAAVPPIFNTNVFLLGYYSPNDGGGGPFTWFQGDSTTANLGTVFPSTSGASGRYKRNSVSPLSVKMFGARGDGVTDDRLALQDAFNVASNTVRQVVFTPSAGAYISSDTLIASGIDIFNSGSTLTFALDGNKLALQMRDNSRIHDGRVTVNGSNLSASSGVYHCPIMIGSYGLETGIPNSGFTNVVIEGVRLESNRTNGSGLFVGGPSSNWKILNVEFPPSSLMAVGVSVNAGTDGNSPPLRTTHPHNGLISGMEYGTNTASGGPPGSVQAALYMSGAYNISAENINVHAMPVGTAPLYITAGDYGFELADADVKALAMQGLTVKNFSAARCGRDGAYIDTQADNLGIIYNGSVSLENCKFNGSGISSANPGLHVARARGVTVRSCQFANFEKGALVEELAADTRILGGAYFSNYLAGIDVASSSVPTDTMIYGVAAWANDLSATVNPGIYVRNSTRTVVDSCILGDGTNEVTQIHGIRVSEVALYATVRNNMVRSVKGGGTAYVLGAGGNFYDCIWEFSGNNCRTGITMRSGLEYVPIRRRLSQAGTIITDLVSHLSTPPSDGTWSQGSSITTELPGPTGEVVSRWFCVTNGTPGTWRTVPLFLNVGDNASELVVEKRLRTTSEFVNTPSAVQSLTATNQIATSSAIVQIQGSGGAVTLTNQPTIAAGFDGQRLTIIGMDSANTVTLQDVSVLSGSKVWLVRPTIIFTNGSSVGFTYNGGNAAWIQDGRGVFGTGTVSSVALAMPGGFSVSGSPVTSSGTLTVTQTVGNGQGIRTDGIGNFAAMAFGAGLNWNGTMLDTATNSSGSASNAYSRAFIDGSALTARTNINFNGPAIAGVDNPGSNRTDYDFDPDVNALATNGSTGFWTRTGSGTGFSRTLTAGAGISIANPAGIAGDPVITSLGGTINSTDDFIPYRISATAFGDSPLSRGSAQQVIQSYRVADNFGPTFIFIKQGRTGSATNSPASGAQLGILGAGGWNGTGDVYAQTLRWLTSEAWASGANGHKLEIWTIPTGSSTQAKAFTFDQNGQSIPFVAAAPTTDSAGGFAFDNNAYAASRGALQVFDGTANTFAVATKTSDPAAAGDVPVFDGTGWTNAPASTLGGGGGYDGYYKTKVLADGVDTDLITFAIPANQTGGSAFVEANVFITTAASLCTKNFTMAIAMGRLDALGGVTVNTAITATSGTDIFCPGLGDILITDAAGTFNGATQATIQINATALGGTPTSLTCYFKERVQGPINTSFPP